MEPGFMLSGTAKSAYTVSAFSTVPDRIQGRKRPHLVLVFATTIPMIGSFSASKILAPIRTAPMNALLIPSTTL